MKIKTKQKLNLPELIQHIMDNEELRGLYYTPTPLRGGVKITESGEIIADSIYTDDTFTVEVCEELTEKTELDGLVAITNHDKIRLIDNIHTIESALSFEKTYERYENIYGKSDGELKLIWSRDSGIPESGVLEVDTE